MKKLVIMSLCVCVLAALLAFGPIPFSLESPTRAQCERMTTKALFTTVLESTETTNLAYVDSWPVFLEKASERYYPLRELESRKNAEQVITAYIEETEGDDARILQHLKAECLLNHVRANADE